jgi:hypothetical protein
VEKNGAEGENSRKGFKSSLLVRWSRNCTVVASPKWQDPVTEEVIAACNAVICCSPCSCAGEKKKPFLGDTLAKGRACHKR